MADETKFVQITTGDSGSVFALDQSGQVWWYQNAGAPFNPTTGQRVRMSSKRFVPCSLCHCVSRHRLARTRSRDLVDRLAREWDRETDIGLGLHRDR